MNTRSKRQSPSHISQPKLKHLRPNVNLENVAGTLSSKQEILNFVSNIFRNLTQGIWLQILAYDDEMQSIQHNLGIKSSLLHPLLRDAGIIGTHSSGKPSVNVTYANEVFFNHNFQFSYICNHIIDKPHSSYFICHGKPDYNKVTHQLKDPLFYYPSPTKKPPFISKAINILKEKYQNAIINPIHCSHEHETNNNTFDIEPTDNINAEEEDHSSPNAAPNGYLPAPTAVPPTHNSDSPTANVQSTIVTPSPAKSTIMQIDEKHIQLALNLDFDRRPRLKRDSATNNLFLLVEYVSVN